MTNRPTTKRGLQTITMSKLLCFNFKKREYLLHPWLRQGESAMVWAQVGLGKTMLTLTMALAVAGGGAFLNWTNSTPRPVLLVDGEMNAEDLKDRLALLVPAVAGLDMEAAGGNVTILSRQFQDGEVKFPDIATPEGQIVILETIARCGAELVILDNFSTLAEVPDENEAAAMNPVLSFLLTLKQRGVACILVHHSGKSGTSYRGSSKLATTFEAILGLKPLEGLAPGGGTAFETQWDKFRGAPHTGVTAAVVKLANQPDGTVRWQGEASEADSITLLVNTVMSCEFTTQDAVAAELGWSKGQVSKVKQKAIRAGKITAPDWTRCLSDAAEGLEGGVSEF